MNFLFFPGGSYVSGMEIVLESLMKQLNAMGHRTLAAVSGWNDGDYPARLRASGLRFEEVKLGRFYRSKPAWTIEALRTLPKATATLRKLTEEIEPDWVIYPDPQLLLIGSFILHRFPSVLYHHNDASSLISSPISKAIGRRAHRIVCVSRFVAAGLRKAGFDMDKVAVVHNGIAAPALPPPPNVHRPICLGIVGQVLPRKQHLMLVRALEALKRRRPSVAFRLKIVGNDEGAYAHEVKELIRRLELQHVVEWTGFLADRDDIYGGLDIVVAAAIDEPFGMTVLEAGIYGLPVVAARSGAFPETVVDGTTGLLFDATELESLVSTIDRLLVDTSLRSRLGHGGRAHVAKVFSIGHMADRFVDVLARQAER